MYKEKKKRKEKDEEERKRIGKYAILSLWCTKKRRKGKKKMKRKERGCLDQIFAMKKLVEGYSRKR